MSHTVSGKLRKAPFVKTGCGANGDSTMYAIELSEVIKAYNSDEKFYTNYSAIFFGKTQGANDFYAKAFAEGSFVVVSCEKLKTDIREKDGRTYVKMQMDNPRLESCLPVSDQGAQPQQQYQQPAPAQRQQAQPQYNDVPMDFDSDIPF